MISGMNTDLSHEGKTYHVQTEDGGIHSPLITTQVFFKGAIVHSQKTSYADIIKADCLRDLVKDLMKQQHGSVIRELTSGRLLGQKSGAPKPAVAHPPGGHEGRSGGHDKKTLDDLILDYLVSKKEKKGS